MITLAILAVVGLDAVFIHYSGTGAAALTFAVLGFLILLLLSATAGSFVPRDEDQVALQDPGFMLGHGWTGMMARVLLGASIPVLLMLVVVYLPDLDRSLVPSQAIRLGGTAATFGVLACLPLVGAVLGFLRPRTGAVEGVLVGGVTLADYALISWGTMGVTGATLQLALYDLMLWPVLALVGAWVGLSLRQMVQTQLDRMSYQAPDQAPVTVATIRAAEHLGETPSAECQTYYPGRRGLTST
jgi:hypothetical protein